MNTAIQLYTLRRREETTLQQLSRVAETSFDGVEFAGVPESGTSLGLQTTGLAVAGAHVGVEDLESEPGDVVDALERVDCERVVVPYLPAEGFESEDAAEETASRLGAIADDVSGTDVDLFYHNHDHEFQAVGDTTGFHLFCEHLPDTVGLEIDVGWVRAAGYDPAALLAANAGRVPLVHLKDVDAATGTPVELGEGDLDVAGAARAAREAGAEWLVYEHDDPEDPLASLDHGAAVLDALRGD